MLVTSLYKASAVLTPAQNKEPPDQWQDPSVAPFDFDFIFLCHFSLHNFFTIPERCWIQREALNKERLLVE